jgi:glycosyltransferase involved in cell wall biosynthesis
MKTKIFVSAYACEPELGSEIGIGWHWVLEMSKEFELWVLTREKNKNRIEHWMQKNGNENEIHFVYYDLPPAMRFWKKGLHGVRVYYILWQKATNRIVRKTMKENGIKIYHLLTYGNSLWPASTYGKKQFFIWGPTGGVDYISKNFTRFYGAKGKLTQALRRVVINTLPINVGFRSRCRNANLILCKSQSLYNAIPLKYRSKAKIFTDGAVDESLIKEYQTTVNEKVMFTTVGRLDAWRNFDVLVEAFNQAYIENQKIELHIVGDGNDRDRIEKLITIRNLRDVVHMYGQVSMEEYMDIMKKSDVIINPTYKEGAVTMSFDAMALGKPLICIETGGYTRFFDEEHAIILKKEGRHKMIMDMKAAILKMTDEDLRNKFGKYALMKAKENTWEKKGKIICEEISNAYGKCK